MENRVQMSPHLCHTKTRTHTYYRLTRNWDWHPVTIEPLFMHDEPARENVDEADVVTLGSGMPWPTISSQLDATVTVGA